MKTIRTVALSILGLIACDVAVSSQSREPALTVRLTPDLIGVEQQTLLEIRVEVAAMRLLRIRPEFELQNLEIVAGPFQEQSMQFVNGSISNSTALRWRLRPQQVGEARVTGISVEVGERTLTANPLSMTIQQEPVAEAEPPARRADPLDEFFRRSRDPFRPGQTAEPELYLRVETNPGDPFVGEPVHYTLYLFTRNDVTAVSAEELPDFEGFWKEEPGGDNRPRRAETVTIDGRKWLRVALLERVLYPLRAGEIEIAPATMGFQVDVDSSGLFRDRRAVRRQSPTTRLTVRPLPEGAPASGVPVGRVSLASNLEPKSVEPGQAARLEVVARSRGNLRRVGDPDLEAPAGLEIYPPQGEIDREFAPSGVDFTRKWSWVVVARKPGSYELPPVTIPYFDPQSETYAVAAAPGPTLQVPAAGIPEAAPYAIGDADLHPIRLVSIAALEPDRGADLSTWLLAAGVLAAAVMAVLDVGSRASSSSSSSGTSKPPTAGRGGSRRALAESIAAISTTESKRTAADLEAVLRSYLVDRWNLPWNCTVQTWVARLQETGLPPAALEQLGEVCEDLHYLRFAPQLSQNEQLAADLKASAQRWVRNLPKR